MRSKQRILFGCYSMVLAIIGDYLLGFGTIGTSSDPDAYMGIDWNVAPDWSLWTRKRRRYTLTRSTPYPDLLK